jgi:YHS domain-containing protein
MKTTITARMRPRPEGGAAAAESTAEFTGDAYPLDHCVVTGDKLDAMGGAVTLVHEGRHVQFCCDTCVVEFKDDPAKWLRRSTKRSSSSSRTAIRWRPAW